MTGPASPLASTLRRLTPLRVARFAFALTMHLLGLAAIAVIGFWAMHVGLFVVVLPLLVLSPAGWAILIVLALLAAWLGRPAPAGND